jgi:hypothetical protein
MLKRANHLPTKTPAVKQVRSLVSFHHNHIIHHSGDIENRTFTSFPLSRSFPHLSFPLFPSLQITTVTSLVGTHDSRRSYSQVLTIVYVSVTWWKTTTCHSQVLQNVCVNVTHDSRRSYSQNCLCKCYMVEDDSFSFSSSPKCLCKCYT